MKISLFDSSFIYKNRVCFTGLKATVQQLCRKACSSPAPYSRAAVKLTAQKKLIMLLELHHFISVPFVPHLLFHITGGMWICAQMCFSAFIIIKFFWCCPVLPNLLACICMLWVLPLKGTFSEDNLRRNKIKLNQKQESDHQNSSS